MLEGFAHNNVDITVEEMIIIPPIVGVLTFDVLKFSPNLWSTSNSTKLIFFNFLIRYGPINNIIIKPNVAAPSVLTVIYSNSLNQEILSSKNEK